MSQIRMKGLDSEYTSESEQSIEGDRGGGSRYAREGPKREERLEGTRIISHSNRSRSSVSLSTTEPEIQPARPVPHYYVRNNDRRHGTARKRHTRSYIELFEPPDQTNNFDCTDKRNQNDQKIYPPVVWLVKVYKQTDERFDDNIHWQKADITYVDDKPLQVSVCDHRTEKNLQDLPPNEKGSAEEASGKRWTGPVISIERCVKADFPIRLRSSPPESVDKLNPKQISKWVIVISSPYIRIGLQKLIEYYPSFQQLILNAGEDMTKMRIEEPFSVLMHYFKTIEAFLEKDRNDVIINRDSGQAKTTDLVKEHMGHLVDFLRPVYEASVPQCERMLDEASPRVTFDMLWYLLRPGIDVYAGANGAAYVAVVMEVRRTSTRGSTFWDDMTEHGGWLIDTWHLRTDGSKIKRDLACYEIPYFSGYREVTDLVLCPAEMWDAKDGGKRRRELLSRSKIFFKALKQGNLLAEYDGPLIQSNGYYKGRVVIDHRRGFADPNNKRPIKPRLDDCSEKFKSYDNILINTNRLPYTTQIPQTELKPATSSATSKKALAEWNTQAWLDSVAVDTDVRGNLNELDDEESSGPIVDELTEHQLLLLYPEALAYALKIKQWVSINLDFVHESVPSDESISNLIIGEDELKTIQALSHRQNSKTKQWSADFIEGKGSGQIILLHGPPGVGKTYTVESISEWLHRPLLALTVADIGTVETLVESELMKWFDLAEAWNAVLLVDEADIFLERRQNRDLARNGLVSAFLRRMEYFKGLLFLTTNRVGQIDDAFMSRVHVAISYQALDAETRKKVWNGFFRKLVRERAGKIQIAPDAKKWVLDTTGETQLNGRDIRNALQTAITLAEFESEEDSDYDPSLATIVTKTHFQKVLEMSNRFRNYVTSIRREDEKKRAQGRGDRNDYDDELSGGMGELLKLNR